MGSRTPREKSEGRGRRTESGLVECKPDHRYPAYVRLSQSPVWVGALRQGIPFAPLKHCPFPLHTHNTPTLHPPSALCSATPIVYLLVSTIYLPLPLGLLCCCSSQVKSGLLHPSSPIGSATVSKPFTCSPGRVELRNYPRPANGSPGPEKAGQPAE